MERWKYWWNARTEPRDRRDVLLYCDAGAWWLEVRHGGAAGSAYWHEYPHLDAAMDRVRELMAGTDAWREIR